jgi:hypothetical protein
MFNETTHLFILSKQNQNLIWHLRKTFYFRRTYKT